jgi:hypothetical protein
MAMTDKPVTPGTWVIDLKQLWYIVCKLGITTRQAMYVQRIIEARSHNHCYRGKAINITYSECVSVVLVIQHAKRLLGIILSSVACAAVTYFPRLSHKHRDFRKKKCF